MWRWRDNTAELLGTHDGRIPDIKFHPQDPNIVASASWDNSTKLWNLQDKSCVTLQHNESVSAVAFTADGKRLITSVHYNGIWIWKL